MNIRTALFAFALAAALPLAAQAASGAAPQGFDAPAAAQTSQDKAPQGFGPTTPTTVENVIKNGADDEYVILRGRFTSHIKSDKYEFQDEAGGGRTPAPAPHPHLSPTPPLFPFSYRFVCFP